MNQNEMNEYLRNRVVLPDAKNNRLDVPMPPLVKRRQFIAVALRPPDCCLIVDVALGLKSLEASGLYHLLVKKFCSTRPIAKT